MEIEIQSKTSNPLLNRTEIQFIIHHDGEGTPKRELIRGELAEKLKVKKEHIIINDMKSSFGSMNTSGYAKVYTSAEKVKTGEREHLLVRNTLMAPKQKVKKEAKPPMEKPETPAKGEEPKPEEPSDKPPEESSKPMEPTEEKPEEPATQPAPESTKEPTQQEQADEKKTEEPAKPKEEQPSEEKKE